MENKHKLFILGLLLSLCLCGCGKTSDQKSDFEYQLLDGWVENKVDNIKIAVEDLQNEGKKIAFIKKGRKIIAVVGYKVA